MLLLFFPVLAIKMESIEKKRFIIDKLTTELLVEHNKKGLPHLFIYHLLMTVIQKLVMKWNLLKNLMDKFHILSLVA